MSSINKKRSVQSSHKKTNQDEDEDIGLIRRTNKNRMISNDVCWCYHPCPHPDFLFDLKWSMGKSTWAVWKRLDAYLGKTVSRLNLLEFIIIFLLFYSNQRWNHKKSNVYLAILVAEWVNVSTLCWTWVWERRWESNEKMVAEWIHL